MLHEVDLVDVPARDRRPDRLDRPGIFVRAPARLPVPDPEAPGREWLVDLPDPGGQCGQGTRLRRCPHSRPPLRLREPVAEEDIGDNGLPAEESAGRQGRLQLLQGL